MSHNDWISDSLGTSPIDREKPTQTITVRKNDQLPIVPEEQFDQTQRNVMLAAETAEMAMLELASLASDAQNPRHYEALTELIKATVNANRELLEMRKLDAEIKQKQDRAEPEVGKTVNNNLFVGSSSDLLKALRDKESE
jgi:hypothetical protein|tara:strand:+ start:703 stop:1122 length:420 start_codon:yes stop_codon:yes gene_type:complete